MNFLRRKQQRALAEDERRRQRYAPMIREQIERNRNDIRYTGDHVQEVMAPVSSRNPWPKPNERLSR
jgi:hypothetical protein